jgi:hypothetical protein
MPVSGAFVPTGSIFDHESYKTTAMTGSLQRWSATMNGESVGVRLSGGDEFANYIDVAYSEFPTLYWGSAPELEFDIDEEDEGEVLILRVDDLSARSAGYDIANVDIGLTLHLSGIVGPASGESEWIAEIDVEKDLAASVGFTVFSITGEEATGYVASISSASTLEGTAEVTPGIAEVELQENIWTYEDESWVSSCVIDLKLKLAVGSTYLVKWPIGLGAVAVLEADTDVEDGTASYDGALGMEEEWLEVDGTTGVVTVIGP